MIYKFTRNVLRSFRIASFEQCSYRRLSTSKHCWKCGEMIEVKSTFCPIPDCNTVQPITKAHADYFELFDIPRTYDIDTTQLRNKFKELQMLLHPDKFSTKENSEKSISEQTSSYINIAVDVLLNPVTRAQYLLRLRSPSGSKVEDEVVADHDFLKQVFLLREEVEDASSDEDLRSIRNKVEVKFKESCDAFGRAFNIRESVDKLRDFAKQMNYYQKILDEINEKL